MRPEEEAVLNTVWLLTVRKEVEAFVRVESPVDVRLVVKRLVAVSPVVEAFVRTEVEAKTLVKLPVVA